VGFQVGVYLGPLHHDNPVRCVKVTFEPQMAWELLDFVPIVDGHQIVQEQVFLLFLFRDGLPEPKPPFFHAAMVR
jgi:hypothetical protein